MIELLKNILKDVLVDAQHIGSTSIKTVPAKPIIDIVVGVFSFEKLMNCNDILLEHGIINRGQDHADQYSNDRVAYTNGKHDFIVNILKKAEEWTCSIG